ncbi:uncharacterized protein [Misgurnus anguillicaudatus]|uniref:uncharacterized protein n=1 Tax=Misgurnus anguillicaudatus TaxID=75329 RepID=UPI003CCF5BB8
MEEAVNEVTAADDRRHGTAHLSQWLSLEDLIEQVKSKCAEGTRVPSKALVRLQFAPQNPYTQRALNFTSRFELKYKIQRRQLRASHPDAHFCAALFKFLRLRMYQLRSDIFVLFIDDKAKIPVGEPGEPVSTGVRGRHSIAPSTSQLAALDHDMTSKGSITSTVYMQPNVPSQPEGSWYSGKVKIVVQDSVFQKSTAYRNAAATVRLAQEDPSGWKPIHVKYSDGGTEHRTLLVKVQLSLIAIFKMLKLDMLIACRAAPGQSWQNPVERVMAILNIGLQNCALEREKAAEDMENLLKRCSSMAEIRKAGEKNPELGKAWSTLVGPVLDTVAGRYSRLKLKGEPITIIDAVTDAEEDSVMQVISTLFPAINPATVTKQQADKDPTFTEWVQKHCRHRQYLFQLHKCDDTACCSVPVLPPEKMIWLPDPMPDSSGDHYLTLAEVMGKDTVDAHRPSAQQSHKNKLAACVDFFMSDALEKQQKESGMFTAQHALAVVSCMECSKPRVIYSMRLLSSRHQVILAEALSDDSLDYNCGSHILEPKHVLASTVQVRLALSCGDPIELAYYRAPFGRQDLCAHCGEPQGNTLPSLLEKFKTVLPCCQVCFGAGKKHIVARPYGKQK